jgi:phage gpG-like protein
MTITAEQFPAWINRFSESLTSYDATPVFREWLTGFMQFIADCFASSQSPSGAAWAPHKRPLGHKLLIDTGALLASVTEPGASGNITEIRADQLRTGTALPYATFVHGGTKNMEARPFLGLPEDQVRRAVNLFRDNIIKSLGSPAAA